MCMLASLNQLAAFISATIIGNWISLPADVAPQLHCGSCDCAVTCPSEGPISLQLVEIVRGQLERCGPTNLSCPAVPACPEVPAPQPCPSQAITAVLGSVLGLLVGLALGRASSPRRVAPPAADKAVAAGGQLRLQEASSSSRPRLPQVLWRPRPRPVRHLWCSLLSRQQRHPRVSLPARSLQARRGRGTLRSSRRS